MAVCELISIGDEILSGSTINSNAAFIAQELEKLGISCARHTALPDDPAILGPELNKALQRADLVISTGGLGPTLDDRTRFVLAELFGCDLAHNESVAQHLQTRFSKHLSSIQDQATIPSIAHPFLNSVGTAPGLLCQSAGRYLIALPGVPDEMRALMLEQVLPWVQTQDFTERKILTRSINICRLPESKVDAYLREIEGQFPECTFGIYPGLWTVKVLIKGAFEPGEDASTLERAEMALKEHLGPHIFPSSASGLAAAVQEHLIRKGKTLSTAESCTGGSLAAAITAVPGASEYFLGSVVSYSNAVKKTLLGVRSETLEQFGAVSEETVREMAQGIQRLTGSDYALSTSGVAGPDGGSPKKPVGTVCFACAGVDGSLTTWTLHWKGGRERVVQVSCNEALGFLWEMLSSMQ